MNCTRSTVKSKISQFGTQYFHEVKTNLMFAGNDAQISLKQQQDMHHNVAELAYQVKIADKNLSKTDNSMTVLAFDLQQCLPTSSLQTSVAFYKQPLWTFNLKVHNMKDDQATCFCGPNRWQEEPS
ncbi:hypothetical protein PR048_013514 [Dryococelus australis]|uniref:Uncharacterized protein n=1 Tax=Dryococelus australis TaxID=614101 RepID=A0ABQ9HSE0_9NEOP|nr:hypothetical protein PR048_013514 [Dryococelus australis]